MNHIVTKSEVIVTKSEVIVAKSEVIFDITDVLDRVNSNSTTIMLIKRT